MLEGVVIRNNFDSMKMSSGKVLNPFPNDKILNVTKLKALPNDKLNVAKMDTSLFNK